MTRLRRNFFRVYDVMFLLILLGSQLHCVLITEVVVKAATRNAHSLFILAAHEDKYSVSTTTSCRLLRSYKCKVLN